MDYRFLNIIFICFFVGACGWKPNCAKSISEEVRIDSLRVKRVIYRDLQGKAKAYQGQHMLALKPSFRIEPAFEVLYPRDLLGEPVSRWQRASCSPEAPYFTQQRMYGFRVFLDVAFDEKHPAGSDLQDVLEKEIYWYNLVFQDMADFYRFTDSSAYFHEMRFRFQKAPKSPVQGNLYVLMELHDTSRDSLLVCQVDLY